MKKILSLLLTVVIVFGLTLSAHATLIDMGNGTIYDNDRNISWLKNANTNGNMDWYSAMAWADSLVFAGYDNWRLPTTLLPDSSCGPFILGVGWGFNCTGIEMGNMFYTELGNLGYVAPDDTYPQPGWGLTNTGPFTNLQPALYWSSTERDAGGGAWGFNFGTGDKPATLQTYNQAYAWAVRDGDVGAPIPEPSTMLLLGSGLLGMVFWKRKQG